MAEYLPGACNIGGAEVRRRWQAGWVGLGGAGLLAVALGVAHAAPVWWLSLFLPVSVAAGSFLQARYRFCAAYGMRGVHNFGTVLGITVTVDDALARAADRRRSLAIGAGGAAIGLAVAVLAWVVAAAMAPTA